MGWPEQIPASELTNSVRRHPPPREPSDSPRTPHADAARNRVLTLAHLRERRFDIREEKPRRSLPGERERRLANARAVEPARGERCRPEILAEHAGHTGRHEIPGSDGRKRRDRHAGGHRLEHHHAEGVRDARKYEDVR